MAVVRINITIDNNLKLHATELAKDMGLSFSALVRLLLTKAVQKNKLTGLEKGLIDYINGNVEKVNYNDFLDEIESSKKLII